MATYPLARSTTVERVLAVVNERLGMRLAWVSSFRNGFQVFDSIAGDTDGVDLHPGARFPLADSYCTRVLDGRIGNVVVDAHNEPAVADLPATSTLHIGAYVGVPIRSQTGAVEGMLCAISSTRMPHLRSADVELLEVFADVVAVLLGYTAPSSDRELVIRERVAKAIREHRYRIVYQPIVEIASTRIVGVEALCRFDDDPVRPDVWFADAAAVGLGPDLELAALSAAIEGLRDLPGDCYLSLNASPATLIDPRLRRVLAGADASRVVLEVTEHDAITDYEALLAAMSRLRELGARIAVDDLGAGFASFKHVLRIRPDIVKVDRSIVASIDTEPAQQAAVSAIRALVSSNKALLVAEGVETIAERDTLRRIGVQLGQGYLWAPRGPLSEVLAIQRSNALVDGHAQYPHFAGVNESN